MEVFQTGSSFKTITRFPEIERPGGRGMRPGEEVEKTHRTWMGVQKRIVTYRLTVI